MLPIVVDLGLALNSEPVQWVLDACSAAVSEGRCVAEADPSSPPRAVAIVRADPATRVVRIEIGIQRTSAEALWLTRSLAFASGDPLRERWRSVGLAVATLAGEVESRAQDPSGEMGPDTATSPSLAAPPSGEAQPADPPAPPPPPPEPEPAGEPEGAEASSNLPPLEDDGVDDSTQSAPPTPFDPNAWLLGVGAIGARTSEALPLRFGAELRAAVPIAAGFQWSAVASYSALSPEATDLQGTWLQLLPGLGYRAAAGPVLFAVNAQLGARRLAFSGRAQGVDDDQAAWRLLAGGNAELWWLLGGAVGAWVSVGVHSSGAESRVLDARTDQALVTVPSWDTSASLGLFWSL